MFKISVIIISIFAVIFLCAKHNARKAREYREQRYSNITHVPNSFPRSEKDMVITYPKQKPTPTPKPTIVRAVPKPTPKSSMYVVEYTEKKVLGCEIIKTRYINGTQVQREVTEVKRNARDYRRPYDPTFSYN